LRPFQRKKKKRSSNISGKENTGDRSEILTERKVERMTNKERDKTALFYSIISDNRGIIVLLHHF
jgi:hypothetical protein